MVARAMDGAALNSPAKLLGRSISASTANRETTAPPIRKRRMYSVIMLSPEDGPCRRGSGRAPGLVNQPVGFVDPATAQQPVLLPLQPVIVHKELFQLIHPCIGKVVVAPDR